MFANRRITLGPGVAARGARPDTAKSTIRHSLGARSGRPGSARYSMGGKTRNSLGARSARPGSARSVRHTNAKAREHIGQIAENVPKLIDFLGERGFPFAISQKTLMQPSAKDVYHIAEFLFSKIERGFAIDYSSGDNKKVADQLSKMFKYLKCPHGTGRGLLVSPGSQHAWQQLSTALVWTVEVIKVLENKKRVEEAEEVDEVQDAELHFIQYLHKAYRLFLDQKPLTLLNKELTRTLDERTEKIRRMVETEKRIHEKLTADLQDVVNSPSGLDQLLQRRATLGEDKGKFQQLIRNYETYLTQLKAALPVLEEAVAGLERAVKPVEEKRAVLQAAVDAQDLDTAEFDRMLQRRDALASETQALGEEVRKKKEFCFNTELRIAKAIREAEIGVQEYHDKARRSRLIPLDAKYAQGIDYSIHFESSGANRDEISPTDIRGAVLPALDGTRDVLRKRLVDDQGKLLDAQERRAQVEQGVAARASENRAREAKLHKLREEVRWQDEVFAKEEEQVRAKIENVMQQTQALRRMDFDAVRDTDGDITAAQREYDTAMAEFQRDTLSVDNKIRMGIELLTRTREKVHARLGAVAERSDALLQRLADDAD